MKTFIFKILISGFFFLASSTLFAHVALDYPEGGESFFAGNIVNVQWHPVIPHDTQNWDLYISYDGGENYIPLILNIPVTELSFMWDVPYVATDLARIKVVQDNDQDIDYTDYSGDFTIVVPPQDGPVFEMPAMDISIECNENTQSIMEQWLEEHGGAIATGTCGDLTWTHNFTSLSDSCGSTGSAMVTFTVSDDCGINNTTARVTIIDSTIPVIDVPAMDITVACDGSGNQTELNAWLNDHGGAMASDACSDIGWTIDGEFIEFSLECGEAGNALVTFIASDECGNPDTTSARFTIVDSIAPIIVHPALDVVFECDGIGNLTDINTWLDSQGGATATDDCSQVSWITGFSPFIYNCGFTGDGLVTFTASDDCGNTSTTYARITIADTTPPILVTSARDTIIECDGDPSPRIEGWLSLHGNAFATDVCGSFEWSHDFSDLPEACDTGFSRIVHFAATDICGNTTVTEATVTLSTSTGLSAVDLDNVNVKIFPNPADREITITFDNHESVNRNLALYDSLGRVLWSYTGTTKLLSVPVQDLASGTYILHVRAGRTVCTRNVIIL